MFSVTFSIQTMDFYSSLNVILKDSDPIHISNCLNTSSCFCLDSFHPSTVRELKL